MLQVLTKVVKSGQPRYEMVIIYLFCTIEFLERLTILVKGNISGNLVQL